MIFLKGNTTGDGLISALKVLGALKRCGVKLSERKKVMDIYPQILVNVTLSSNESKVLLKEDAVINEEILRVERSYEGRGRVLVRASGTEPLIRVMVEGQDESRVKQDAQRIAALIKERLG